MAQEAKRFSSSSPWSAQNLRLNCNASFAFAGAVVSFLLVSVILLQTSVPLGLAMVNQRGLLFLDYPPSSSLTIKNDDGPVPPTPKLKDQRPATQTTASTSH